MSKYIKLTAFILIVLFTFSIGVSAFAYEVLPSYEYGNTSELLFIKRPETLSASTTDRTYTISAVGREGITVTVFRKDYSTGDYNQIWQGDSYLSANIGPSGLYSVALDLVEGENDIRIKATDYYGNVQVTGVYLTRIRQSAVDQLGRITVNVLNIFGLR